MARAMKTYGPRMNRERTHEVLDKLGITVVKSNSLGAELHRTACTSFPGEPLETAIERWRVYTGGGIAGNSDKVWLSSDRPRARAATRPVLEQGPAREGPAGMAEG
jgi:hypothetical protein